MKVRSVEEKDYDQIMVLIDCFAEESLFEYGIQLDSVKLQKSFDQIYQTSFVLDIADNVVGVFGGEIITDICSEHLVYNEWLWYVKKEHRRYGMKLLYFVESWCYTKSIERMVMSAMHNLKTEKLFSLYKKLGFRPLETKFIKQLTK